MIRAIWKDQRGQDTTEYALVAAFVAAAAVAVSPAILAAAMYLGRSVRILDVVLATTAAQ